MSIPSIKEISLLLGYTRSKDFLAKYGTNASSMSQMKLRNPNGYEDKLISMIVKEKGLSIRDLLNL